MLRGESSRIGRSNSYSMIGKKKTDIRIQNVRTSLVKYHYRTPMKFGGRTVTECHLLNVECEVATRDGRMTRGFGSMPLSNTWAYPSAVMDYDQTLAAMTNLADRCARICERYTEFGHPVEIGMELEERFLGAALGLSKELGLAQAIPKLATLVTGSAFDAAIHDGFGKAHGLNCYHAYGHDFMSYDLGAYMGPGFNGAWLEQYVNRDPAARLPLYHLVGALDPLTPADVARPIGDGLPETLSEWIRRDGLSHLKIKLNGDDSSWDLERIVAVNRIAEGTFDGVQWRYSLDFNERCQNVDYLIDLLSKLRERSPIGFDRVQYVEQPTARDLRANPQNRMHAAAKLKPVVIDESLTDYESLILAREMGYTGVALKACKGQSQSLLLAAAARRLDLFLCVQDLTCPGASLIQSASLAAHIPGVSGIEANSRQYCPVANLGWEDRFPGVFRVRDGEMDTSGLCGLGLGAV
jgi:L-alanine-DL-glutamate epimerase-like enolase superfamily enzyme